MEYLIPSKEQLKNKAFMHLRNSKLYGLSLKDTFRLADRNSKKVIIDHEISRLFTHRVQRINSHVSLFGAIVGLAIYDVCAPIKELEPLAVDSANAKRQLKDYNDAREYLNQDVYPHAEICGINTEWVKRKIDDLGITFDEVAVLPPRQPYKYKNRVSRRGIKKSFRGKKYE